MHLYFNGKLANFGHFMPTLANWPHQKALYGLILHSRTPLKVATGPIDQISHYEEVLESIYAEKN